MPTVPRRILVADHHTERLPSLVERLEALGHSVFATADVLATLEALDERRPDVLVLAPLSRRADGPEVERILAVKDRRHAVSTLLVLEQSPPIPVVADLAGRVDDVLVRDGLTAELLFQRVLLAIGRLERVRRLEEERTALERQSITDFKTGTFNDRYFHRRLKEEFGRARRQRQAISCIMLDFDNFKEINDNFDHAFGDFVLLAFAKKLRSVIRDIDVPARLGGDEFVLLLPSTGLDQAVRIAERIRRIVSEYLFEHDGSSTTVSLSIGISTFDGVEDCTPEEFLRRADCALLEAKRRGRNRVVLWPQVVDALGREDAPPPPSPRARRRPPREREQAEGAEE